METWAFFCLLIVCVVSGAKATTFVFKNNCPYPVWVGTLSGALSPPLSSTGFQLLPGATTGLADVTLPWSGRFFGRTFCTTDSTGKFICRTGDCGSGKVECGGRGAVPPASLVEITTGGYGGKDFYDISLVDGYNLPVSISPQGGTGDCQPAICASNVNLDCPPELRLVGPDGGVIGCKSACEAFGSPEYCCTGAYGSPSSCHPTQYSLLFKNNCPKAYSYAYDDASSTFTCTNPAGYTITFCP